MRNVTCTRTWNIKNIQREELDPIKQEKKKEMNGHKENEDVALHQII